MTTGRLAIVAALLAIQPPQSQPIFQSKVEIVRIDVSVMRGGQPVGKREIDSGFEVRTFGAIMDFPFAFNQLAYRVWKRIRAQILCAGEPDEIGLDHPAILCPLCHAICHSCRCLPHTRSDGWRRKQGPITYSKRHLWKFLLIRGE